MFLELNLDLLLMILGWCTLAIIFILLIVALVKGIIKTIKRNRLYHKNNKYVINPDLVENLRDALGDGNVISTTVEMSRITISVKDVDIVKADVLKDLGATGVLLVGNQVKVSFANNASEVNTIINGFIE